MAPDDKAWLTLFDAGSDWWCEEVTGFLRQYALEQANAGYNTTVLFTRARERLIIGFLTIASSALKLSKIQGAYPRFGPAPGVETPNVPVWLVAYMGVHHEHQGATYGEEMHVWLLTEMVGLLGAPRFLYLQCWVENDRAMTFWKRLGYKEFDRTSEQYGQKHHELAWLLLDRFAITSREDEPAPSPPPAVAPAAP